MLKRKLAASFVAAAMLVAALGLSACSPKVDERPAQDAEVSFDASSMGYVSFVDGDAGNYPENYWTSDWNKDSARGCNACHEDLWDLVSDAEPLIHLASSDPGYGVNADWTDCYGCHNGTPFAGNELNDMIHNVHYGSPVFNSVGATCMSCHAINPNGEFVVYDLYKHSSDMGGFDYAGTDYTADWVHNREFEERTVDTYAGITVEHEMNVSNATFNNDVTAEEYRFRASNYAVQHFADAEEEWTLSVTQGVKNPTVFTLEDLKALPQTEMTAGAYCVGNTHGSYQIANIPMKGVLLEDIIEACGGLEDGIVSAYSIGYDGWFYPIAVDKVAGGSPVAMDLEWLFDCGVMIALEEYGKPLSEENGYPATWILPGSGAGSWVKWLEEIVFTSEPGTTSFWRQADFTEKTNTTGFSDETMDDFLNVACVNSGWWTPVNDGDVLKMENGVVELSGFAYSWGQNDHRVGQLAFSADYGVTWTFIDVPETLDPMQMISWTAEWTPAKGAGTYELYLCNVDAIAGWQTYPSAITVTVE